jgi:hypothetical protein
MTPDFRNEALQASEALKGLHRALIRAEIGKGVQAFQQLHRLMHDPSLAWLRPLSQLLVDVDQLLSEVEELPEDAARSIRAKAEVLLGPASPDRRHGIQQGIANLLWDHPQLAMALGDVRRALKKLPESQADS